MQNGENWDEFIRAEEVKAKKASAFSYTDGVECLPSGFPELDRANFFRRGQPDLVVVAARPSHGKTAFALQLAANIAEKENVLFYSKEMTGGQLRRRLDALISDTSVSKLPNLSASKKLELEGRIDALNLFVDDDDALDINSLISRTIDFHKHHPLSMLVVDYLQIIGVAGARSRAEEVTEVANKLKSLAKHLNVPVTVLAQMNRNVEARAAQNARREARPMMSDLADSSGIEKWADIILFMHRPYLVTREREGEVDFFAAKHRHGRNVDVTLNFSGELTKFFSREGNTL